MDSQFSALMEEREKVIELMDKYACIIHVLHRLGVECRERRSRVGISMYVRQRALRSMYAREQGWQVILR